MDAEGDDADLVTRPTGAARERRRVLLGPAEHLGGPKARDHQDTHQEAVGYWSPSSTGDHRSACAQPLRVGILADTVDHPGGIGRYVREVLARVARRRSDVRLVGARARAGVPTVHELAEAVLDHVVVPPRSDQMSLALWDRYRAGRAFAAVGAEVIIGTKHLVPRTRLPTVLVVHDVLTITRAHENALAKRLLLPAQYRRSLTDASASRGRERAPPATRLGALDPAWEAKCEVVPNGMSKRLVDATPEPPPELADRRVRARRRRSLAPEEPGAAHRDSGRARTSRPSLTLVVVGPDPGADTPVRAELLELERSGRAVWIRGANDRVLRWCYEHARVVLFPTYEEGFGLPLLEAMTFHAPVVASTDLALREVADGCSECRARRSNRSRRPGAEAIAATVGRGSPARSPPRSRPARSPGTTHTERLLAIARAQSRADAGLTRPRIAPDGRAAHRDCPVVSSAHGRGLQRDTPAPDPGAVDLRLGVAVLVRRARHGLRPLVARPSRS